MQLDLMPATIDEISKALTLKVLLEMQPSASQNALNDLRGALQRAQTPTAPPEPTSPGLTS
jgi:hypothetical protein